MIEWFFYLFGIIIIGIIISSEVFFRAPRNRDYPDPDGYTSHRLTTMDGVEIQLWYTNHCQNAMIIIHGHTDHSAVMISNYAPSLKNEEYDLIFVDLRNHGRSQYSGRVTIGIEEALDVYAAIEWAITRWKKIVVFGTSMGSVASLKAVVRAKRKNIRVAGLILDSFFVDIPDTINRNLAKNHVIQPFRLMIHWYLLNIRFHGIQFPNLLDYLKRIDEIPKLVLHGQNDVEADPKILEIIEQEKIPLLTTKLCKECKHSESFKDHSFKATISNFLQSL